MALFRVLIAPNFTPQKPYKAKIMTTQKIDEKEYTKLERDVTRLLKSLKPDIGDEYRACDDDDCPGMQVTIGATPKDGKLDWSYQTGDNSYSGGAYSHRHWGVIYLYRRSNCKQLAKDAVSEIADGIAACVCS